MDLKRNTVICVCVCVCGWGVGVRGGCHVLSNSHGHWSCSLYPFIWAEIRRPNVISFNICRKDWVKKGYLQIGRALSQSFEHNRIEFWLWLSTAELVWCRIWWDVKMSHRIGFDQRLLRRSIDILEMNMGSWSVKVLVPAIRKCNWSQCLWQIHIDKGYQIHLRFGTRFATDHVGALHWKHWIPSSLRISVNQMSQTEEIWENFILQVTKVWGLV